jgi:hypothetical protein
MSSLQTCSGATYNWKFRLNFTKKHLWCNVYGTFYLRSQVLTRKNEKNPTPKPPRLDVKPIHFEGKNP